jgi:hypothetical protein
VSGFIFAETPLLARVIMKIARKCFCTRIMDVWNRRMHKAPETEFPFLFLVEATFTEQMLPMLMPLNIIQFYV